MSISIIIVSANAESCFRDDIVIQQLNSNAGTWNNVFIDYTQNCDSPQTISGWHFYAFRPGRFNAAVWRRHNDTEFTLVGRNLITAQGWGVFVSNNFVFTGSVYSLQLCDKICSITVYV